MSLNINSGNQQYPEATGFGALGQLVKGHLEGGTFNRRFVADTVTASEGTQEILLPPNTRRPDLPPPILPVSLVFSLSEIFNANPNLPPINPNIEPTLSDNQAVFVSAFYDGLGQNSQLTDSDKAKLQFAFFNPDVDMSNEKLSDGTPVGQALQALVGTATASAAQQGVDVTKLNPPVDNKDFNLNISDGFNNAFEQLVNASTDLTPEQKAALIFAHYNPNTPIPNADPKVMAQLKVFEDAALKQISGQFGIPAGFQPKLNSDIYNAGLTGDFKVNLQLAFNAVTAGLSQEEINAVKSAIENMDDPNIPPNIKATAQKILDKAINQTQADNSLPVGFQLSSAEMKGIFDAIAKDPITAGFVQIQELISTITQKVQFLMPDGPEKSLTLDLLQSISAAIIKARKTINEMQVARSEQARNESQAKLGMAEQQIRERQEQSDEIAEQTQKQQTMQKVMDVLGPIMKVFEVIMAIATGGVFAAIFVALDMHFNFMSMAIDGIVKGVGEAIDKAIPSNGNPETEKLKHALKALTQVVVLTAMMAAGVTVLFSLIGGSVLTNLAMKMVTESEVIKEFCLMCGIPEKDIQWVVLAVTLAITLAVTIVSCINPASFVKSTPKMAMQALDTAEDVMKAVDNTLDIVQSSINIASKVENIASGLNVVDDVAIQGQNAAKNILKQVSEMLNNVLTSVMNQIKNTKGFEKLMDLLESVSTKLQNMDPKLLSRGMLVANVVQTGVGATNSALQGGMSITQSNIALSKGKHEAVIAELEAMIKNLQKVLNSLLSGLSDLGDDLNSLNAVMDNLLSGLQQTLDRTTSIQIS